MTRPFTSEEAFLAAIDERFPNIHPHMILGRGDDCAILRFPQAAVLTTDLFIEDVHFRRAYFTPEDAGYKALAVNLSDIAAMGGQALGFSLGLAGPPGTPAAFWEGVLDGLAALAKDVDLPLTGGDLNACAKIVLAVTVWGQAGPSGRLLRRKTCLAGDVLFTAGELGLAKVGLSLLEEFGQEAAADWPQAVAALLRPRIRLAQGLELAGQEGVRGLMDVSDGLARDLPRFIGPELGASLTMEPESLPPEVLRRAGDLGLDPAGLAVTGGEDYALLGSCSPEDFGALRKALPYVRAIGRVTAKPGLELNGRPFTSAGFDHFQK